MPQSRQNTILFGEKNTRFQILCDNRKAISTTLFYRVTEEILQSRDSYSRRESPLKTCTRKHFFDTSRRKGRQDAKDKLLSYWKAKIAFYRVDAVFGARCPVPAHLFSPSLSHSSHRFPCFLYYSSVSLGSEAAADSQRLPKQSRCLLFSKLSSARSLPTQGIPACCFDKPVCV